MVYIGSVRDGKGRLAVRRIYAACGGSGSENCDGVALVGGKRHPFFGPKPDVCSASSRLLKGVVPVKKCYRHFDVADSDSGICETFLAQPALLL